MAQESEDLNFASGLEQFQDIRGMLPSYLNNIGLQMLTQRQRQIEALVTIEDVSRRRAYLRERMLDDLGGFPERTPLNARVVGVLQRTAYKIEKVIFESQPHFYVTANLYLPTTGHPPYPAILFPLGHEPGGKTNPTWQQMLGSLATKGFVALTWDPIGQGERLQIFDEDLRESKVGDSTMSTRGRHPVPADRRPPGPVYHLGRNARPRLPARDRKLIPRESVDGEFGRDPYRCISLRWMIASRLAAPPATSLRGV
jgi:hypothetical protein